MPKAVWVATIFITLALGFYSGGVWSEKIAGRLKRWHVVLFWLGLVCDTAGTGIMLELAGGFGLDIHGLTGTLAILLMIGHAVWATVVVVRQAERALVNFHRLSLLVWAVWLVPYGTGFFASMH
jgi:uncharacterized repeat protein (TIGR03987 family)